MGRYDDAMYRYLSDNDRFADLFNAVFFGGKKVLRGEQLEPDGERYADEPGDLERFGMELKHLLEVLKLRQDKDALLRLWEQEEFSHIDRDTAETIAVLTDSVEILDKLEDYENKEGGGYSMCLAVDEMRKEWKAEGIAEGIEKGKTEGRAEGIAEGIIETGLDFGLSESAILERLQQKMQISLEKAQEYFAMYSVQTV